MILFRYKTNFGRGDVGARGGCPITPPREDIGRWEERAGWFKNKYVTTINEA